MSEDEVSAEDALKNAVVVVVVSFRRPNDIVNCLASLQYSSLTAFEVVVVENGGATAFDRLQAELSAKYGPKTDARSSMGSVADPDTANGARLRWDRVFLPGGQPVVLIDAGDNLGYGGAIDLAIDCIDKN